jgi:hypothetical protein
MKANEANDVIENYFDALLNTLYQPPPPPILYPNRTHHWERFEKRGYYI